MAKTNFKMVFLNAEIRITKCYIMASKGPNLKDVKPKHGDLVNGSIQSRIDPFASFACQTTDNCNNSYCGTKRESRANKSALSCSVVELVI